MRTSVVRVEDICPDDRSGDHGHGSMRAHRIANGVGQRFAGRPDRFRVRMGDSRNPLFRYDKEAGFAGESHALGFAPEFMANVDPTVTDLVTEMRKLSGQDGLIAVDGVSKVAKEAEFQNEAMLWTMVRSFLENKLTVEALKSGKPDLIYRLRVLNGVFEDFCRESKDSNPNDLMHKSLHFIGAFLPEVEKVVEFYPSSEAKELCAHFERFALNCGRDMANFRLESDEKMEAGIIQASGSLRQGVMRFLTDLQRVQAESNLLDERKLKENMAVALDPFVDELQTKILRLLTDEAHLDEEDVEIKLREALATTKFDSVMDRVVEAVEKSTAEDIPAGYKALLIQGILMRIKLMWSGSNGLGMQLIGHLKYGGHLKFLHQQATQEHTRARLGGVMNLDLPNIGQA